MDLQAPNLIDGVPTGLDVSATQMRDLDSAARARAIREYMGYKQGNTFARQVLHMEPTRWNNIEQGYPISKAIAFQLVRAVPGLTTDWVWFGKTDGLPLRLAQELEPLVRPPKGSTAAS